MSAALYDISIYRGDSYRIDVTLENPPVPPLLTTTPLNLTGYTVKAALVLKTNKDKNVLTLTCTVDANPATGKVAITALPAATAAIKEGIYYWDLQLSIGTTFAQTVLYGDATVTGDAAR